MSVPVGLERDGGIMRTTENIIWVKKWCDIEEMGKGKDFIYIIKSFKQIPSVVDIEYSIPNGKIKVPEKDVFDREKFIQTYSNKVFDFIKTALEDGEVNIQQMLLDLEILLKTIYPGMLMPLEVERESESQII